MNLDRTVKLAFPHVGKTVVRMTTSNLIFIKRSNHIFRMVGATGYDLIQGFVVIVTPSEINLIDLDQVIEEKLKELGNPFNICI